MKLEDALAVVMSQQIRQESLSGPALANYECAVDIVHRCADRFIFPNRGYNGHAGTNYSTTSGGHGGFSNAGGHAEPKKGMRHDG